MNIFVVALLEQLLLLGELRSPLLYLRAHLPDGRLVLSGDLAGLCQLACQLSVISEIKITINFAMGSKVKQ